MARGPGRGQGQKPARGPRQKLGPGPKQGQRPGSGPKQGRGPGLGPGKGQKPGPGQGQGRKAGPGQKAGPRSEHGPAVPLRSRSVPAGSSRDRSRFGIGTLAASRVGPGGGPVLGVCVLISTRDRGPMSARAEVPVSQPPAPVFPWSPLPVLIFPRKDKKDNMKPKHPDEQEIPFRLRELMRSREALKRPGPGKRQVAGGTRRWPQQVAQGLAQEPTAWLDPAVAHPPPSGDVPPALCRPEGPRGVTAAEMSPVSPREEAAAEVPGPQGPGGRPCAQVPEGQGGVRALLHLPHGAGGAARALPRREPAPEGA